MEPQPGEPSRPDRLRGNRPTPSRPSGIVALVLAGVAWALGLVLVVALPDPPYLPPDVEPAVRYTTLAIWVGILSLALVPAAVAMLMALLVLRKGRPDPRQGDSAPEPPARSISARMKARGGESGRATARLAAALGGAYLAVFGITGSALLVLGKTPGDAMSPAAPKTIGAQRLLQFGRQVEDMLRDRDVHTLAGFIDYRPFLARAQRLAPSDRVRLRRVREAVEGEKLAERILGAFPVGARPELTVREPGPPILLSYATSGRTLRLEIAFWRGYLTIVDVHDDRGPWSEQFLQEVGGR